MSLSSVFGIIFDSQLYKKGNMQDPDDSNGITLLNLVDKSFSRLCNNLLLKYMYIETNAELQKVKEALLVVELA